TTVSVPVPLDAFAILSPARVGRRSSPLKASSPFASPLQASLPSGQSPSIRQLQIVSCQGGQRNAPSRLMSRRLCCRLLHRLRQRRRQRSRQAPMLRGWFSQRPRRHLRQPPCRLLSAPRSSCSPPRQIPISLPSPAV